MDVFPSETRIDVDADELDTMKRALYAYAINGGQGFQQAHDMWEKLP